MHCCRHHSNAQRVVLGRECAAFFPRHLKCRIALDLCAYKHTKAAKTQQFGSDHPDTLMVAMNLGTVVKEKGDFARAEAIFAENYQV